MIIQDLHMHTLWDDGSNSTSDMVASAASKGLSSVGVCIHSPLPNESWCAKPENIPVFVSEMKSLAEQYSPGLSVYCGLEYDSLSSPAFEPYDYIIGSVHMLDLEGKLWAVDDSRQKSQDLLDTVFHGNTDAFAETYFAEVEKLAGIKQIDIVGHFDLLTKFNEPDPLIKTVRPRYLRAAESAMEKLSAAGKIFEINTGAISRGYRSSPYPSNALLCTLHEMGGRILLSSDAHSKDNIAFAFDIACRQARAAGFAEMAVFNGHSFSNSDLPF